MSLDPCPAWVDGIHLLSFTPSGNPLCDVKVCLCGYSVKRVASLPAELAAPGAGQCPDGRDHSYVPYVGSREVSESLYFCSNCKYMRMHTSSGWTS